ncbi:DUF1349 domain-containing protein [Arthrobacter sp. NEB 688]|uniref:DUF1349 domain-containing protein n=1 Tax=Arthrobacter sp. NEB 688 TaxID=904039 RepID=UPI002570A060|nr:DUF1349 domain-containing protein [Arthrobacter sp. NEB 688]
MSTVSIPWSEGSWTHEPVRAEVDGQDLLVTASEGSDAWRTTSYGFVHDSEHALLRPLDPDRAVEVTFTVAFTDQFDQAGVFLRASPTQWVKAGVEFVDGVPCVGVVATRDRSDWSAFPVPDWAGRRVTVRASRTGDAVTVRAKVEGEPFVMIRVLPLDEDLAVEAGPFVCAPTRPGLTVRLHAWRVTPADATLH